MHSPLKYSADLTAGSLKPRESRLIAGLLLAGANEQQFREVVVTKNVFQACTHSTAVRLARLRTDLQDALAKNERIQLK